MRHTKTLALVAGLVSATGFAPLGLWPLTLAAFALLIDMTGRARDLRGALALGYWFGVGHFTVGLNWIAHAFTFQDKMPAGLGYGAVVALALYLAVYPAMATGLMWRWGVRVRVVPPVLVLAIAWIVTEWLRATMFTGFAWNPLGVVLVDVTIAQVAALIGTYGLSGIVILLAGALLAILRLPGWRKALAAPLLLAVAIDLQPPGPAPAGPLVRVVQPNIGQQDKHEPSARARNFARLASLTGTPGDTPRLILWPEAAVPDFLEEDPWARARIAALIGPDDMLLTGGVALIGDRNGKVIGARNSLFAMTPDARLVARYDKAHLVPYGEYLPMRPVLSLFGLSRLVPGDIDFEPGPGPRSISVPGFGRVGVQICYEIIFAGHVIDARDRPAFLFNPSNDAWFGAWGPPQHLAQARLRAIEEAMPVVRSTPTGISAIIDADGRILGRIEHQRAGVLEQRLPVAGAPTPFAMAGNLLSFIFAALLFGLGVVIRRRTR
jgi:apolipoprotein N-acyltransferase